MKKFRLFGVLLSAAMLAACSEQPAEEPAEIADNTEAVTLSETTVETTAATASETTAETTTETTTEQVTETTSETETEEVPQTEEGEYVQVSPDNEFIDFEFIEDYQGTTEIGGLAEKAIAFMKKSEQYKRSADSVDSFTFDGMIKNPDVLYSLEEAKRYSEEFSEYISDGVIEPKISAAYPADYDGDGNTETFIIIKMPYSPPHLMDGLAVVRDFVVFADKDGNMEIIDETSDMYPVQLLNYGKFKQIVIGGEGMAGVEDHTCLYGVLDGKLVRYYGDRCSFKKEDCFLSVFGWQGVGDFMYFDTSAKEYRVIDGVDIEIENIRAMDTENSLADILESNFLACQLIGGKYYCFITGMMDWGTIYTYDSGSFTLIKDSNVRISTNLYELKKVIDIDIEQALASMKSVQK